MRATVRYLFTAALCYAGYELGGITGAVVGVVVSLMIGAFLDKQAQQEQRIEELEDKLHGNDYDD